MPNQQSSVPAYIYIVAPSNMRDRSATPTLFISPKQLWDQSQLASDTIAIAGELETRGIVMVAESVFEVEHQDLRAALAWLNEVSRIVHVTSPNGWV